MAGKKGGVAALAQGRSDVWKVDPRILHVKPSWNGRDFNDPENQGHVETLANQIAENGVKQPLTVVFEGNKVWVIDGECRLRATMLAIERGHDIKSVPVRSEDRAGNDADRLFSQIVRNSGKAFTPLEQAGVFQRLLDYGWQQADIARKAGTSPGRVSQLLGLLTMPENIKRMVGAGQVSASLARQTLASHKDSPDEATKVLQAGVAAAKSEGKKRATPKHVNGESGIMLLDDEDIPIVEKKTRVDIEHTMSDALDASTIDNEAADDQGRPVVIITMPFDKWELVRQALKY